MFSPPRHALKVSMSGELPPLLEEEEEGGGGPVSTFEEELVSQLIITIAAKILTMEGKLFLEKRWSFRAEIVAN